MSRSSLTALGCVALLAGCDTSPSVPTGPGVQIVISYRSLVPASVPWTADTCGAPGGDRRPAVLLNWSGSEMGMAQDLDDPDLWHAEAWVTPNIQLDVSLRDPGLCRVAMPWYGEFAWSGVSVNGTPLRRVDVPTEGGRPPCFGFTVNGHGEIILDVPR